MLAFSSFRPPLVSVEPCRKVVLLLLVALAGGTYLARVTHRDEAMRDARHGGF